MATPPELPLARWEGHSADELARRWGVPALHLYRSVGSTNDAAYALAETGCPAGVCVLAEEQTAGRGRGDRSWSSPPGLGIWLSLVLRPQGLVDPGVLPLVVGLGVARGLDPFCTPAEPQLKWPNDVLLAGRKLGGILCEGTWEGDRLRFVVAGIGLNLLHMPDDFPPELRAAATSVRIAAGWSPAREEVARAVVSRVMEASRTPALDPAALAELERRDALRGREVALVEGGEPGVSGRALGIAADGSLLLRTGAGVLRRIRSGSVRLVGDGALARDAEAPPAGASSRARRQPLR